MISSLRRRAPGALLFLLAALAASGSDAVARVPAGPAEGAVASPAPIRPEPGERVAERNSRLEVDPGTDATDVRVVIARFAFEPGGWTALPTGPAWKVVPAGAEGVALAPLGLGEGSETRLWWAVTWTEARTGAFRASPARSFVLLPRFTNRGGADGVLHPSARGRLESRPAAGAGDARRAITLASGHTLLPDGPTPASVFARARAAADDGPGTASGSGDVRGAYLVQFSDDAPDAARARITAAGGTLVWSIADEGWVVRLTEAAAAKLAAGEGGAWIVPYAPAHRMSPELLEATAQGRIDVTALLFEDGDTDAAVVALGGLGATQIAATKGGRNRLVRFELDAARIADAAALADVAWIERTAQFTPFNRDARWVVQSGVPDSRPVHDHGLRGQGELVMVSDSGLRTNHEMFDDPAVPIETWGDYPTHRKVVAYKPVMDTPAVTFGDVVGFDYHGTHTSGTVAGDPSPTSAAPWGGMAPDARIYFMDMGGADGGSFIVPGDLNDVFRPSYLGNAAGAARIASNSWGNSSAQGRYLLPSMQVDQFAWDHPDYLIAYSAGNIGAFATVSSPANAKNVLTVGATGNGAQANVLAPFSSRGPAADGRRKPTVVAPGNTVVSSVGSTRYAYAGYGGTSMATPAVAGAMALVRQYLVEGRYPTGVPVAANALQPSAALLRAMAVAAGRNDVPPYRVPDNTIGFGRLTIDDVLHFPGDALRTVLVDPADGLADRDYVEYVVNVTDSSRPLKVALCWTDAPGSPAATVQLVNDLDLLVTHDGTTYRGNAILNFVSVAGGPRDSLNVEELVRLAVPSVGPVTIRVEARRIVQGPQRFALCVTGGVGGASGAVALDRFEYALADTVDIEVTDTDASGPVTVRVTSASEPGGELVSLTGANGVFRGRLAIGPVPGYAPSDGILAVASDDVITATYTDASPAAAATATARIDVHTPILSGVQAKAVGSTSALVTWTTDVAATSRVRFGTTGTGGAGSAVVDSVGYTTQHAVLLTGLAPQTTYRYDVESTTPRDARAADSAGGAHRAFTTPARGAIALIMDDPSSSVLETWRNALGALGVEADVLPKATIDPPLVGNTSAGLRSYQAVLWQVDPNRYPPFSDAQRAAIDSLLDGGGRLLVTGHDIGFGLSDAGSPSYSAERESWLESTLKARYYVDNLYADTLTGVAGSVVSGAYTAPIPFARWIYPDGGDNVGPVPSPGGTWAPDWTEDWLDAYHVGMHWESDTPRGTAGVGVWGGRTSRLVGQFFEWRALVGESTTHQPKRTGVLGDALAWLLDHRPPEARLVLPVPGTVVMSDFVAVRYSLKPAPGRTIVSRELDYSLDGGASWAPATTAAAADSGWIWDLGGILGGTPTPNATNVLLRLRVADDGSPSLRTTALLPGAFTLARPAGDTRGPVIAGGSAGASPIPLRPTRASTLVATFSDAETGGGKVAAAEYSSGPAAAPAGSGLPMLGAFGTTTVQASVELATAGLGDGSLTLWVRARDTAGNWGAASSLVVPTALNGTVAADDVPAIDFLGSPNPNPFRAHAAIRFGLARAGDARLELFDVAGRRVRTLAEGAHAAGTHVAVWDGRDTHGRGIPAGVYFVRLVTPEKTLHARVVALD